MVSARRLKFKEFAVSRLAVVSQAPILSPEKNVRGLTLLCFFAQCVMAGCKAPQTLLGVYSLTLTDGHGACCLLFERASDAFISRSTKNCVSPSKR